VVGRVELRSPQLKVAGMELMKVHILIHFRDSVPLNCDEARVAQDILLLMRILETLSLEDGPGGCRPAYVVETSSHRSSAALG